jgi:hypothetical protein
LLKYLIDKWTLGPLGQRAAQAKTFAGAILSQPRTDTPISVPLPQTVSRVQPPAVKQLTNLQRSIVALSHALESMSEDDPNLVAARSRQVLSGYQSQIDAAVDRVDSFIQHQTVTMFRKTESLI